MKVEPYLILNGKCEEAIEFYKKAVGARVEMCMRFKDAPPGVCPAGMSEEQGKKVMHASLNVGETRLLMSDGRSDASMKFDGFSLTVVVSSEAEAKKYFDALGEGGKVTMPLAKTFYSPSFGMLNDRFGVSWMVIVQ